MLSWLEKAASRSVRQNCPNSNVVVICRHMSSLSPCPGKKKGTCLITGTSIQICANHSFATATPFQLAPRRKGPKWPIIAAPLVDLIDLIPCVGAICCALGVHLIHFDRFDLVCMFILGGYRTLATLVWWKQPHGLWKFWTGARRWGVSTEHVPEWQGSGIEHEGRSAT